MTATPVKARILLVDNLPDFIERWTNILERIEFGVQGYCVASSDWLEICTATARQFRPHVVMADLRLENEYRPSDVSGLELVKALKEIYPGLPVIVYSAYLDDDLRRRISESGAEYFKKGEDPRKLLAIIEKLAAKVSAGTRKQPIGWPNAWKQEEIVAHLLRMGGETPESLGGAIDDLLHQAFSTTDEVRLAHVEGHVGIPPGPVSIGRSLVAAVCRNNLPVRKIVKVAPVERIRREAKHYEDFIRDHIKGVRHTQLEQHVEFWDIGASIYTFLEGGEEFQSFAKFVRGSVDVNVRLNPVEDFVKNVWRFHYQNSRKPSDKSLWELYDDEWKLGDKLRAFTLDSLDLDTTLAHPPLVPVDWVLRNAPKESPRPKVTAITHGDFHGDNLFTDGQRLWAIDFERTGYGHILRDFCELEVDLVTRCLLSKELSQQKFYLLAIDLVNAFMSNPPAPNCQSDDARVLATANKLRSQAFELLGNISASEYCWALLFDTLFVLTNGTDDSRRYERQRAWILASLLCQRLQNWNQAIIPVSIERSLTPGESNTPSGEFTMLTHDDLTRLKKVINQHPSWRYKNPPQRRSFLQNAGLAPARVDNLLFDGTSSDTEILLSDLVERPGRLARYPAYTALGRLLDSLLKGADDGSLEIEGAWFLAQCVVRYRLIEDAAYLAELEQRFGVWGTRSDLGWKAQPYPSSWTWLSTENLEKIWSQRARFADSVTFFERGLAVARATGRIETAPGDGGLGDPIGTGFLVGPNLLLTNHHVISPSDPLHDRQVRFGYRIDQAGKRQEGQTFALKNTLVSSQPEQLDFSLIQVEGFPGDNPEIGFLRLHAKHIGKDTPLYVIQHPSGEPQKVVLQDNWCIGVSSDQRRVYYTSNTLGGSSGSPVCNEQWEVVALHHAGGPTVPENRNFQGNEGILMKEIVPLIQQWLSNG